MSINMAVQGGGIYLGTDRSALCARVEVNGNFGQLQRMSLLPSGTQFNSLHVALAYQPTYSEDTLRHRFFAAAGYTHTWHYGEISNSNPSATARLGVTFDPQDILQTMLSIEGVGKIHIGEHFFLTGTAGLALSLSPARLGALLFVGPGVSF